MLGKITEISDPLSLALSHGEREDLIIFVD